MGYPRILYFLCDSVGKKVFKWFRSCWILESWPVINNCFGLKSPSVSSQHVTKCPLPSLLKKLSYYLTKYILQKISLSTIFPLHSILFIFVFRLVLFYRFVGNPVPPIHLDFFTKLFRTFLLISDWKGFIRTSSLVPGFIKFLLVTLILIFAL